MGKIRRGRMEREDVPVITAEWVQQHQYILTPRDIAMLTILAVFPVVTIEHLYLLTPQTATKSGQIIQPFYLCKKGMQLCRDRIRRLYDWHFVNKFSPKLPVGEGTAPQYIWLDRAGYRYFDMPGRPLKQLTQEYLHHTKILDVYSEMVRLEREGIIKIDLLEPCYSYKPKTASIEPDLVVAFQKGNYGYKYLIEMDTGEKKESDELKKLDKYRDWELSSQWIKEDWAGVYKRKFPTVLYIFSGAEQRVKRRVRVFRDHAKEAECRSDFLPIETFREKILSLKS